MRKRRVMWMILAALFPVFVLPAFAADTNLQITPPPLIAPEFESGRVDTRVGVNYVGMSGTGISATGYGVNAVQRWALNDRFACGWQAGYFTLDGDAHGGTLAFDTTPLGLNLEYQPFRTDSSSLILFAGAGYARSKAEMKNMPVVTILFLPPTPSNLTLELTTRGWQAGAQYGAQVKDVKIVPFAMYQSLGGNVDLTADGRSLGSASIPSYNVTTFGFDLFYLPWNTTLSSALQMAEKSDSDSSLIRTTTFSLSHLF